jgi:hypothetical protein
MTSRAILFTYVLDDEWIFSPSQKRVGVNRFVPSLTFLRLPTQSTDQQLGESVLHAFDVSAELPETNDDPTARDKEWQKAIARECQVKSYREFRKRALCVTVYEYEDGRVQVAPTIHEKGWFLIKNLEIVTLVDPTAAALGATLKSCLAASS